MASVFNLEIYSTGGCEKDSFLQLVVDKDVRSCYVEIFFCIVNYVKINIFCDVLVIEKIISIRNCNSWRIKMII